MLKLRPNEIDLYSFYDLWLAYLGRWHERDIADRPVKQLLRWVGAMGNLKKGDKLENVYPFHWDKDNTKLNIRELTHKQKERLANFIKD